MRKWCWGIVAVTLVSVPARADVIVLSDDREIRGKATVEGESVVVRQEHGETRFPRSEVKKVLTDDEASQRPGAVTKPRADDGLAMAKALESVFGPEPSVLSSAEALTWEKDAKTAERLAAGSKKIVLTFVVVGDLGTGHC